MLSLIDWLIFFLKNQLEKGRLTRYKFKIINLEISNAYSDGIDSDFSNGSIINSLFNNIGGDAIDTSGSNVSIVDTKLYNARHIGLSAGENSTSNIEILKSGACPCLWAVKH